MMCPLNALRLHDKDIQYVPARCVEILFRPVKEYTQTPSPEKSMAWMIDVLNVKEERVARFSHSVPVFVQ